MSERPTMTPEEFSALVTKAVTESTVAAERTLLVERQEKSDAAKIENLRDYFAGQALAGLVAGVTHVDEPIIRNRPNSCAELAYLYADAMLAARAQPPGEEP